MDLTIDQYEKLLETYKAEKALAVKVNKIFSQGNAALSDPEHEAIVAGFLQNGAVEGLFESVNPQSLGTAVLPTDPRSTAIALLTKKGYEIVATDKDIAGEAVDILARKPNTSEAVVFKCGPAMVKKVISYLERPGTELWILDNLNRLFVFRRGANWESFMAFHREQQEKPAEPDPVREDVQEPSPEEAPAQDTPAEDSGEYVEVPEEPEEAPPGKPDVLEPPSRETPVDDAASSDDGNDDYDNDAEEEPEERADLEDRGKSVLTSKGATFTIGNRKIPRMLSQDEVAEMIKISKPIPRDSLLLQCMYFLGMSNAEIQNLRAEDINFQKNEVKISEGKNRRDRALPMPADLADYIKAYLGARTEGFLIRGRDKKAKRISDRHIRRIVKAYAKEANVPNYEEIHPHTLRHSYAMHLLDQGTPLETVQKILGHERLETTAIYSHARNARKLQDHVKGVMGG